MTHARNCISFLRIVALVATGLVLSLVFTACGSVDKSSLSSPVPTVTIVANPTSINNGGSSTLALTAANATQVTLTGTDGSSYTLKAGGGTQTVSPSKTTTYTATVTGSGGSAAASVTVTVAANPMPSVSITANPGSVASGSSSILTVSATNATQVNVTGTDGTSYALPQTGGTQAVNPTATTTYTATATGKGGTNTAATTVAVSSTPAPSVTITAVPPAITPGSISTLTASAMNATQVGITGSDGSSYPLLATGGTQTVSPTMTTTYTVTATGPGGATSTTATVTVTANPAATVSIVANPTSIALGNPSTLTVTATNATGVAITGTDNTSYSLAATGGTQVVSPTVSTTYTALATGVGGNATDGTTVTVKPAGTIAQIGHVIFMQQENHTFDNYFGMLNPYRKANGWNIGDDGNEYDVDGIDDKLSKLRNEDDEGNSYAPFKFVSTCTDDNSSDWLASFGDVTRYNHSSTRPILMDGFVHNGGGYATSCVASHSCSGAFTDLSGKRAMGYYDQGYLNYYYWLASQFAVSDRWFSPIASKSVDNRIATFTGGTTQGLVKDPGGDDHLPQLPITTIFQELDQASVSWKIYYTVTQGFCLTDDECSGGGNAAYPATYFSNFTYSYKYLHENHTGTCAPPTQPSSVVGDAQNSFCIDPDHIAPLDTYFTDLTNGTLPSFIFIEAGYGNNDEHPGSGQSVLLGQAQVAKVVNALMNSSSWSDSAFFFAYDEGGGPYDHVPPVPGHSNDFTDTSLGKIPDISTIAVNPDGYFPCVPSDGIATMHCDLSSTEQGSSPSDASAIHGFAAQLGFRVPNAVISPFTRRHFVSHTPIDHTAVIKFVENRFIGPSAHLTARDAVQPDLLEFFDFNNVPWAAPPTPPSPVTAESLGHNPCTPSSM